MTDVPTPDGTAPRPSLQAIRGGLEDPPEATPPKGEPAAEPKPDGKAPPRGARPERQKGEIWPGCPVIALGVHRDTFFYLDILGQLAPVANHTKDRMRGIFGGRGEMLTAQFPQFNKGGEVSGWAQEKAATAMMRASAEKGVWSAFERVRGLGAWPDGEGGVALHCGDQVLWKGKWRGTGEIEGYVYPSAPPIPRPLGPGEARPKGAEAAPAQLLQLLESWAWLRGDLDAWLLMGWICAAMFGGAIDWRPLIWITGDAGTGKSTVQKLLRAVMGGEGAILQSTDATEPGIRQVLMQSTIPVALDELEAEADNRKSQSIIKLARQAASGGVVLRGGADHVGQEFRARSTFAFSSILVPPLLDQDISRIALLELMPLPRDTTPPIIEPKHWGHVGRAIRARILDQWPRMAETVELYRLALHAQGHSARGCDQYGTLLAMADLAWHEEAPDAARSAGWAGKLGSAAVSDQVDQQSDWQRMLVHLLGQHIEPFRSGQRYTLGRWILAAAGMKDDPTQASAQSALPSYGLKVEGRGDTACLIIANVHPMLAALFRDTHWGGSGGQKGVWSQAVKRIPGATPAGVRSFDGVPSRTYRINLTAIPNLFGDEAMSGTPLASLTPSPAYSPEDFA